MDCSTLGLPVHHQLLEFTETQVHWVSQWCHPTISSSVIPFSSCLQSFPASGSFQMSQLFASGGQSIRVSASASVLPMNIQVCLSTCKMKDNCTIHDFSLQFLSSYMAHPQKVFSIYLHICFNKYQHPLSFKMSQALAIWLARRWKQS